MTARNRETTGVGDHPLTAQSNNPLGTRRRQRTPVARDIVRESDERATTGQRLADRIAQFGGSWTFILFFLSFLVFWVVLNTVVLGPRQKAFDPFPYIFLNLFLSMIAALQAPVIMMSQNRASERDRLHAAHDYEVNLESELEIRELHDKFDTLREREWTHLVQLQQQQIDMLTRLLDRGTRAADDQPGA